MAAATQMRKVELELPENVYQILKDLSVFYGMTSDESLKEIIRINIDMELDSSGGVPVEIGKFLQKKHNYKPDAWRKDQ